LPRRFQNRNEKLKKKRQHNSIEKEIIEYFFNKNISELTTGDLINGSTETPLLKKRLDSSGGFRIYFLVLIKSNNLYLMFVHRKTTSLGLSSLSKEEIKMLCKKVLSSIELGNLYVLTVLDNPLIFKKNN